MDLYLSIPGDGDQADTASQGEVAQLGEHLTGSQEVVGSSPIFSTRSRNPKHSRASGFFVVFPCTRAHCFIWL